MFRKSILAAAVGADDAQVQKIRDELKDLKDGYETRIRQLEQRLEQTEQRPAASAAPAQSAPALSNAFNPAISLILGGQLSNLQRDPATYQIGGFIPGGDEIGPGSRSFNLGESELTVSANIDPYFSGVFIAAMTPENEVEVEEAYVRNIGSIPGATLKFGRFLSGFGYLNEIHAHAWDFVDAPLVHQTFFGGQLKEDGIQARWLAPTPMFVEFGVETYVEANTRFLLRHRGWSGLVMDGSAANVARIRSDPIFWRYNLKAVEAFITRENIDSLIESQGLRGDIGLLSIDIDGNDYWVWEAVSVVRPAIVVIEYNARFGTDAAVTVPYDPGFVRAGRVIVIEDDLAVAPGFLEFMNRALDRYAEDDPVMQVCGFMFPVDRPDSLPESFFLRQTTSWGWATWASSLSGLRDQERSRFRIFLKNRHF